MSDEGGFFLIGLLVGGLVFGFGGCMKGTEDATDEMRREAIHRNYGRYIVIDRESGRTQFEWIEPASPPPWPNGKPDKNSPR